MGMVKLGNSPCNGNTLRHANRSDPICLGKGGATSLATPHLIQGSSHSFSPAKLTVPAT